jgi:hypothetical protein
MMRLTPLPWILLLGAIVPACADSAGTQTMVITVRPLVSLSVTKTGAITLEAAAPGDAGRYAPVQLIQPEGLRVYHNLPGARRVQAEASMSGAPNDLDLTCATAGRPGATLIKRGVGQGAQTITGDVAAGLHCFDLLWEATATGPGTPAGDYRCDIRFTLTEN